MASASNWRHDSVSTFYCIFEKNLFLTISRDRATYDPTLTTAVSYTVASSTDAPSSLTYGPSFISLAASYGGEIILGLNRRLNNISNSILAAELAQSEATNLYAMELGNEPNCKVQSFPISGHFANSTMNNSLLQQRPNCRWCLVDCRSRLRFPGQMAG